MVEKEGKKEKPLYQNLTGNSRIFGIIAQIGFGATLLFLFLRYFLRIYGFHDINGTAGDIFQGIADFFGLAAFLGFGLVVFALLSLALVGKEVHLYLRIGILIALGMIIGRFLSLGFFF